MTDPDTPNNLQEQRREMNETSERRAPFDTSELNNIPRTTDEDPPYRDWWVVDGNGQ
ncbi:MAG: hypothetical protein AB7V13_11655 [Pseudorhodoplanes sp.]|uniref:hypothetical protein n=1 Tax=Pseudorhodoplanes sp. TaxID=1934341 RepID=UPI003D13874C